MKKELLCPVGSMDAFYAAVHAGADAVYLAGKAFGARSSAQNFTNEELAEVIKYAHLYDVSVYVTVNTLIKDDQLEEVMEFIDFLHKNSVDAVILQDIGLANLVRKTYPKLELHASTQMHNLDKYSAKFLKEIGFKRIVVARELSLKEINSLETDLEIECFIHGALCISYSGACLMSSMAMNRSGNKGACSQLCRMPYDLLIEDEEVKKVGKYLLSPKDLNASPLFEDIMKSNVHSLKIEGRMKSAEYVYTVTKMYRKLIDAFYENKEVDISEETKILDQLFNRGYSTGHLENSNDLMGIKRGNHKGVVIGQVISLTKDYINIKLSGKLHVGDGIKFDKADRGMNVFNIYKNREIIKEGAPYDLISIPNNIGLKEEDTVLKTVDVKLNESLKTYEKKKVNIDIKVEAKLGKKLNVTITDGNYTFTESSEENVSLAQNKAVSKEDIIEKITKLGTTAFTALNIDIDMDENIFIRLSELNNIRRLLTDKLTQVRSNKESNYSKKLYEEYFEEVTSDEELSVFVRNELQLDFVSKYPVKRIYTNNYELYEENKHLNIYYEVKINESRNFENEKLLINSTSDLEKYKENNEVVLGYGFNVFNSNTVNYLNKFGVVTYSPEFTLDEYKKINRKVISSAEAFIYGKTKVMTMKHCLVYDKPICDVCKYKNSKKNLKDSFDRLYELECSNGVNYLYDYKDILKIKDLKELRFYGIKKFRIDFYNEREGNMRKVLSDFFD